MSKTLRVFVSVWLFVHSVNVFSLDLLHGVLVSDFRYEEVDEEQVQLLSEAGNLAGAYVELSQDFNDWSMRAGAGLSGGNVDYSGATQSGVPLETDTEEFYQNYWFSAAHRFSFSNLYLTPEFGFGFWRWDRDIQSSGMSLPLSEDYQWLEYQFGLSLGVERKYGVFELTYQYLLTRHGTVSIDLSEIGLGEPTLDLGHGQGDRVSLSFSPNFTERFFAKAHVYYEAWEFGRSNTERIVVGSSVFSVQEPRSTTRNYALSIALGYRF